jgi:hypothetical protein
MAPDPSCGLSNKDRKAARAVAQQRVGGPGAAQSIAAHILAQRSMAKVPEGTDLQWFLGSRTNRHLAHLEQRTWRVAWSMR